MNRTSRTTWMLTMAVAVAVLFAGWRAIAAEPSEHHHEHSEHAEQLHETMEQMGKLYKQVRGSLRNTSKYADAADAVAKLEMLVVHAKAMTPEKIEKMPHDQQTAQTKKYRLEMCKLLGDLTQLESALLSGDQAKATAAFGAVHDAMSTGHNAYREHDD